MFYDFNNAEESSGYNVCNARGACSITPRITSLQEVILIFLKHLSFYTLKLKNFGVEVEKQTSTIIKGLASIISSADYTDEQMLDIIGMYYGLYIKTRDLYKAECQNLDMECEELKFGIKITPQMSLSGVISQGEKMFLEKYNNVSTTQRNMTEILLFVLKSLCINLLELKSYGESDESAEREVLKGLEILGSKRLHAQKLKEKIEKIVMCDNNILKKLSETQISNFGEIREVSVSKTTTKGKAILVSGSSLVDLRELLAQTQGKDIDIYTHGDLLIAHAFRVFEKNENLKGHYGDCSENCILDFATFPGAIILTRNSYQNIEYLYRGRLFTMDDLKPNGVVKLEGNDFSPLINSALNAKGFAKGRTYPDVKIGCNLPELAQKFDKLVEDISNGKIEKLLIIGHSNGGFSQSEYFSQLFKHLGRKTFVLSFSQSVKSEIGLTINLANNLPSIYSVLKELFSRIPITSDKLSIVIARCDVISIAHMISLKKKGAKKIFLSNCQPKINPSITETLEKMYDIRLLSTAEKDAKLI